MKGLFFFSDGGTGLRLLYVVFKTLIRLLAAALGEAGSPFELFVGEPVPFLTFLSLKLPQPL
jgi:hypothetical protein